MPQPPNSALPDDLPFALSLRRVNRGVGYVALCLPLVLIGLTVFTNTCFNQSISHYYYSRIGGDIFVGALTFIGLLLAFFYSFRTNTIDGYLRHYWYDIWLIKLAGFAAFLIAYSPTTGSGCIYDGAQVARAFLTSASGAAPPASDVSGALSYDMWATFPAFGTPDNVPLLLQSLHFGSAAVMFTILGYFSFFVFTRINSFASIVQGSRKGFRNVWYRALGVLIFACVGLMGGAAILTKLVLSPEDAQTFLEVWNHWRVTFILESVALMSFGLSWMIKGRFIKAFEDGGEH